MATRVYTDTLGDKFSEGARLLWLAMRRSQLSQEQLRLELQLARGVIGRWLRGERRPDGKSRGTLFERFEISPTAWDSPPSEPFTLPSTGTDD